MTDFDVLVISVIVNVGLLIHNLILGKALSTLKEMLVISTQAMASVADGKAMFKRTHDGKVALKEIKHEKDKPSTTAV